MTIMRQTVNVVLPAACALLLAACSPKNPPPPGGQVRADSAAAADSLVQASALPADDTLTYEQRQGKFLYTKYCVICHGAEGKGDGFNAYSLDPKPRDFTDAKIMSALTNERIAQTISGGGRSVNRSSLMPSWGGRMSKEEIEFVRSYIRTFAPQK